MKMSVTSCLPDRYDLPNVQVQVIQLCNKHSCHCFIECGPIHIDCSTNRQHKSGDPLVHLVLFFNTAESDRQGCRTVWLKRMEFMAQVCSSPVPAWRDSSVPKSKPRAQSMLALWQIQESASAASKTKSCSQCFIKWGEIDKVWLETSSRHPCSIYLEEIMTAVRRAWAIPMANRKGFFRTTIKYISGRITMEWIASL